MVLSNIEDYAELAPQYYDGYVEELIIKYFSQVGPGKTILDCGCGDGRLLFGLSKSGLLQDKNIYAIDLSESRIQLVKKINPKITAIKDNAETIKSIPDQSIDFFISSQVIEHVDEKKMIENIIRVTKPESIIYISTVFKKWYGWYFYRNRDKKWVIDPTHLREYQKEEELVSLFNTNFFILKENKKTLLWFPVVDFIIKRIGVRNRFLYDRLFFKLVRKIKIPIFGYYKWELVFKRK